MGARVWAAATVAATLLAAGCSGRTSEGPPPSPTTSSTSTAATSAAPDRSASYVALGDSFTAGPGLPRPQDGAGFCQRSSVNWPTLLADGSAVDDLTDLSCAGATSADVLSTVSSPAIGAGTELVTIGVGGNDGGLFAALLRACAGGGGTCGTFARDTAPGLLADTRSGVQRVVEAVRTKAPAARIVVVGYLRIMPARGTCDAVGIPAADVSSVVGVEDALDATLAEAARRSEADFVSVRDLSAGHDACAGADAWTNGRRVADGDGIVFHPRAAGMAAVARAVAAGSGSNG